MKRTMFIYASLVIAAISSMIFAGEAHARTVSVPSHKGKVYADFLKRSCKPSEWKTIAPFLEQTGFHETQFPSYEFEMGDDAITSTKDKLKIDMETGKPRMSVAGESIEGSLCEIAVQISARATVAKFDLIDFFVEKAHAREVLKTEKTKMDYAKWIAMGVGAGAGAVATSAVPILAGAFIAAGSGAIAGSVLATETKIEWNRRTLETHYNSIRKGLLPVACSDTTVVFRASGNREVVLTRGKDPDIYIKTPQYEGRLRASFSSNAKSVADRYKTCRTQADVVKFNERYQAGQRQQAQRRMAPPRSLEAQISVTPAPPTSLARAADTAPVPDSGEDQLAELDGLFEVSDAPAAPAASASSN